MKNLLRLSVVLAAVLVISACGGSSKPITLADVPAYPGATELQPGSSQLAAVLANNGAQAAQISQAAGVNSKVEQKGYTLPAAATWDAVSTFFNDKLKAMGFAQGVPGGSQAGSANNILSAALAQQNQANSGLKMAMYSKDKQTLTIMMLTDPTSATPTLVLSLNSN
jgi:hypothetical protein